MQLAIRLSAVAIAAGLLSSTVAAVNPADIPADTPISSLLSSAQTHLARGETSDALVYYDAAIARDPSDYLTYFKRATTYLSLGRTSQATDDFGKVLQLKPGFEGAHVQLGRIRQRVADWDAAREQFVQAGKNDDSQEVAELEEARKAAGVAAEAEKAGNWEECVNQAGTAILVANRAPTLRNTRAKCRFARGEMEEGLSDLMHVLNMRPGDTSPHVTISATMFYGLGDTEKGIAQIRKCLQSDPDSKVCRKLLKQQKAVEKVIARVDKAFGKNQPSTGTKNLIPQGEEPGLIQEVKDQVKALKEEGVIPETAPNRLLARLLGLACQGYYDMNSKKGKDWCEQALSEDENALYGLLHKAKQLQEDESFEAAIETLKKAAEAHPEKNDDLINNLLNDANVKLRRSKTKDYYKVLGVAHDADERQIKSAYRKLSKVHHPDKAAKAGITKEAAEKKMASINEAYEVLSDPELRRRFDQGDDPMSNEQQNPFQQGGFPFGGGGGGGQQFKFHFGSGGGFPGGGFPGGGFGF